MRYDTLHPSVLVNLSINTCTEKKTEGVKDCAETFVRQSYYLCIFAICTWNCNFSVRIIFIYYFVRFIRNLYDPILYKYDIIHSPCPTVFMFTMKQEYVIELKGFVCLCRCGFVAAVLTCYYRYICLAAWPEFDGEKKELGC